MVFGSGEVSGISGALGTAEFGQGYAHFEMPALGIDIHIGKAPPLGMVPPSWADTFKKVGLALGGIFCFAVALSIFPATIVGSILLTTAKPHQDTQRLIGAFLALPLILGMNAFTEAGIINKL